MEEIKEIQNERNANPAWTWAAPGLITVAEKLNGQSRTSENAIPSASFLLHHNIK